MASWQVARGYGLHHTPRHPGIYRQITSPLRSVRMVFEALPAGRHVGAGPRPRSPSTDVRQPKRSSIFNISTYLGNAATRAWKSRRASRWKRIPEISHLPVQSTYERRPRGVAFDIGRQAPVAGNEVGVLEGSQHRRRHQMLSAMDLKCSQCGDSCRSVLESWPEHC